MRVAGLLVVALVVGSGCATTHVSPARFVSRTPSGGVVATPRADVGMDDANEMIAAHCGGGGYAITREGEALVGDTVVTEAAASVDAQTTEGAGQIQGHDSSKTVYARGSDWQVHYNCNDPRTVNMGLITRSRTTPSKFAWGADIGAGMMFLSGKSMEAVNGSSQVPRSGAGTALGANGWIGYRLSDKFSLGGGLGIYQVVAMPQWDQVYDTGAYYPVEDKHDAQAIELFAAAKYSVAPKVDMQVRVGLGDWSDVNVDGATPFAALGFGYRIADVAADSGVYIGASLSSGFSSSLTDNVSPALTVGYH